MHIFFFAVVAEEGGRTGGGDRGVGGSPVGSNEE